jgi:hypothetical protein
MEEETLLESFLWKSPDKISLRLKPDHFMNKRFVEKGINEIMMLFDKKTSKLSQEKKANIGFTSFRASRYDKNVDYSPNY